MTNFNKNQLRQQMLTHLKRLPAEVFIGAGQQLALKLQNCHPGLDPGSRNKMPMQDSRFRGNDKAVALFKSLRHEIDTKLLFDLFPQALTPTDNPEDYAEQIINACVEIVFVPGLAFDLHGHRLGRGSGYYDRCITKLRSAKKTPKIIGLCLKSQIVSEVPTEPHDQRVDLVLTGDAR